MPKVARAIPTIPVSQKSAGGGFVTVACKLPNGLALQLQTEQMRIVDTPTGPKQTPFYVKSGKIYYVKGPSYPVIPPKGYPKPPHTEGGYALTRGIPQAFWDQWWEQNKMAPYCNSEESDHGFIFAYADLDDAASAAIEHEGLLTGLEPLSTDVDSKGRMNDPRMPRPLNATLEGLKPDNPPQSTSISGERQ